MRGNGQSERKRRKDEKEKSKYWHASLKIITVRYIA